MTDMPLISVIIPIYNAEKYLSMSLTALKNQTYQNFEAVMINDGSTDESAKIAQKFVQKDSRFKLFEQPNAGGSVARNKGLKLAQGEYIAFLDNDDIYAPNYLETLLSNLQNTGADVSCCSYIKFYGDGNYLFEKSDNSVFYVSNSPFIDKFQKKKKIEMLMWCKLYKKNLFNTIEFNKSLPAINDMLLNIEILLKAKKLVFCREPLIAYRILENSQTNKRLSDSRINEYYALAHLITDLSKTYSYHKRTLQKIASRYAFGQCIEEIMQKYDEKKDADIYQKMREVVKKLKKEGFFDIFSLGLRRWLKFLRFYYF